MNTVLTDKESLVMDACKIYDASYPGCYVLHTSIIEHSKLAPRSLGGVIASMQKKGLLHAFYNSGDVEVTCQARKHFGMTLKKTTCNHPDCSCARPKPLPRHSKP